MSDKQSILIVQTTFPNEGKRLRGFIMGLIKGKIALTVQRINYMKSYSLQEGEYTKLEEKMLLIKILPGNKERFEQYLQKNHPYSIPELIYLSPLELGETYLGSITKH